MSSSARMTRSMVRAKQAAAGQQHLSSVTSDCHSMALTPTTMDMGTSESSSMPIILRPSASYHFGVSITAAMRRALTADVTTPSTMPTTSTPAVSSSFAGPELTGESGRSRQQQYQHLKRMRKRRALEQSGVPPLRLKAVLKHCSPAAVGPVIDAAAIPHSKPGWIGDASARAEERVYTVKELLALGFEYKTWDGRDEMIIPTDAGRAFVHFIGHPDDPPACPPTETWESSNTRAAQAMTKVASENNLARCKKSRGDYPVVSAGMSFGGGPQQPYNVANAKCADTLLANADIKRIAHFQSNALAIAAPKLYMHYHSVCSAVRARHPELKRNFTNSVFPTIAFNCGSNVVTEAHVDSQNVAYGLCAITALGHYDYKKGGHLFFWELRLIVEFPPGATVLIPSAAITHGNTPIATSEQRASITQYMAGSLVRYVDYGFCAGTALEATDPAKKRAIDKQGEERWQGGLEFHSLLSERQADVASCFAYTSF